MRRLIKKVGRAIRRVSRKPKAPTKPRKPRKPRAKRINVTYKQYYNKAYHIGRSAKKRGDDFGTTMGRLRKLEDKYQIRKKDIPKAISSLKRRAKAGKL